jgi:hypothetical protein
MLDNFEEDIKQLKEYIVPESISEEKILVLDDPIRKMITNLYIKLIEHLNKGV